MFETRLPKVASALHALSIAALILFPGLVLLGLVVPSLNMIDYASFTDVPLSQWSATTWLGFAIGFIPAVFLWCAVYKMCQLFALYRMGDPLVPQAGPLIKSIGSFLLLSGVLTVLVFPVKTGLMSLSNPVGERSISVALNSSTVGFILVAGLLLLIGWSVTEAQKSVAENKEFI